MIMATALAIGAMSHWADAFYGGLQPYPAQPAVFNAFWSSLMVLNPVAAVLLVVQPRWGLVLALGIMACDVGINTVAFGGGWPLWMQAGFAMFVLAVTPLCWRNARTEG
ncbi:MAG: hypothetical protein AB8H79_18500 [Myxococcota bacterium]